MRPSLIFPIVRTLIVAGLAVAGYLQFVHSTEILQQRMGELALQRTGLPGFKDQAESAKAIDATLSPLNSLKNAAEKEPAETGSFSANWLGLHSSTSDALLFADLLPSQKIAAALQAEATQEFLSPSVIKSESLQKKGNLSIPNVSNATGAVLFTRATSTTPASTTDIASFRLRRIVVIALVSAPTLSNNDVVGFVQREAALVTRVEPHFSLTQRVRPVLWSVLWILLALVLLYAAAFGPWSVRTLRSRRLERQQAQARRQYQMRGSKVLRQQRARARRR